MMKKSAVIFTNILLASSILVGCNVNEPENDRSQLQKQMRYDRENVNYDDNYQMNRNNYHYDNDDINDDLDNTKIYKRNVNNINAPGVDQNDNLLRDDENDADPDPEDIVEDPKDMIDRDRRDE
ncbi:hypothetical protein [Bacillus sp. AFS041924]|uniref:hypothetical protein n=1 Tax=Bacillus sp. AFS041924 TaxID=2033503 RepID=UPI000BFCDB5D|nr:hypothetical protein [Bacillus sp. AFS041924]PGS51960.1 hypothetical protein COC46_10665 [Bacillus sp. AFS041924]